MGNIGSMFFFFDEEHDDAISSSYEFIDEVKNEDDSEDEHLSDKAIDTEYLDRVMDKMIEKLPVL